MNWKIVLLGGLGYFVAVMLVGIGTGMIIHDNILATAYDASAAFWRPELNQEPPDMAALMPMWMFHSAIGSLVIATLYSLLRPAFTGPGWRRGLSFGLLLAAFVAVYHLGWSGYFNLPGKIWLWWTIDATILLAVGCTVVGLIAAKVAPDS